MLYYNRIDVSYDIDVSASKKCCYWYFLYQRFRLQPTVYKDCCDVSMLSFDTNNISVLKIIGANYR